MVKCDFAIMQVMISYDSSRALVITSKSDRVYYLMQFNLSNYARTFEEKIGGNEECYIKCKEIEQNMAGDKYAVIYLDNGVFKLRTFGKIQRTEDEILENELNINLALGINDHTMPIDNFNEPYSNCTFINNDLIFIALFHNKSLVHHHALYSISGKNLFNVVTRKLNCSAKNFPFKSFYNEDDMAVYSFYRQG
jgi:hypothetical protein